MNLCNLSITSSLLGLLVTSTLSAQDLCATASVTGNEGLSVPVMDKPAVGVSYIDPVFGTTITRITDAGAGGVIKPMYNTIQAWNADESLLLLYQTGTQSAGHYLYDARSFQLIKQLAIRPPDIEQVFWDHDDPDRLYFVNTRQNGLDDGTYRSLIAYQVSDDSETVLHSFEGLCDSSPTGGNDVQMMRADSDVIGLRCGNGSGQNQTFSYRLSTNTVSEFES